MMGGADASESNECDTGKNDVAFKGDSSEETVGESSGESDATFLAGEGLSSFMDRVRFNVALTELSAVRPVVAAVL
jgi:hypothetical protein